MADSAALTEVLNESALKHLLRVDHQEDLCFALWTLSQGITRRTALLHTLILPNDGERRSLAWLFFTAMLVQVGKDSVMMIIEPKEATRRQFKRLLHSRLLG